MSQMEHHIGKLTQVLPRENESIESLMSRLLEEAGKAERQSYHKDLFDQFEDEMYKTYIRHNGKVYKIEDKSFEDDSDIIVAELKEDNSISYQLRFYNGGASFGECLEEALDKLNKQQFNGMEHRI